MSLSLKFDRITQKVVCDEMCGTVSQKSLLVKRTLAAVEDFKLTLKAFASQGNWILVDVIEVQLQTVLRSNLVVPVLEHSNRILLIHSGVAEYYTIRLYTSCSNVELLAASLFTDVGFVFSRVRYGDLLEA